MPAETKIAVVHGDKADLSQFILPIVLLDKDEANIEASKGGGKIKAKGKKVCVYGDEKSIKIETKYMFPPFFPVPGKGIATIWTLTPGQVCQKTRINNKPVIMKGDVFITKFEVKKKAFIILPNGSKQEDPLPFHIGLGKFTTSQDKFHAS